MDQASSSSAGPSFWFVGAAWGGSDDQTQRFIDEGVWENGYEDRLLDEVREMRPGERIAIKSTFTQKHNLPFQNFGHAVSVMRVKAIGTIAENLGDGRRVLVRWESTLARDWYFYTGRSTIWRVTPDSEQARALIAFAFEGADQDYDWWCQRPYWRDRLRPPGSEFAWTNFYESLADVLRGWRDRRSELIQIVHQVLAESGGLAPLIDQFSDGSSGPLTDIDPFTFFGIFNRRLTTDRRLAIARSLADRLEVPEKAPLSLEGIPVLNNQKSWFFHYAKEREPLAIERLWDVFESGLALTASNDPASREEFALTYDAARLDKGVRYNLGIGLFWISPWRFPSLDAHTRTAIERELPLPPFRGPPHGEAYLAITDGLFQRFESGSPYRSIPQLVRDSWHEDDAADEPTPDKDHEENTDEASDPSDDRYRTQADDPAQHDALERGPFAAVLAARVIEVRNSQRSSDPDHDQAFMVHIHGPWGSGKSSILNLLRQELERVRPEEPASLVVWFNAWKHQRMRPPWWSLLSAISRAAEIDCGAAAAGKGRGKERRALRQLRWGWQLRADWGPYLIVVAALIGIIGLAAASGALQLTLTAVGGALALGAAIYTYARPVLFGSTKAAQTYSDLTTDPYGPVVSYFGKLVSRIQPPLVVFIDDLDRCDSDYVVELLEGIQTLFRGAPVTYVVAADRKWICSSFEKKYGDFSGSIGEPCRPLGYLFLDKIFQISAGMPNLTPEIQASYLKGLLHVGVGESTTPDARLAAAATERVSGLTDEAAIQEVIEEAKDHSVGEQRALRAAAAMQITSAEAARDTEHRLQKFAHLLEPNPRSMKRLVNDVGMAQARGILEGRTSSPETRARWAMLSLRWPVLAEFIARNPESIRYWIKAPSDDGIKVDSEGLSPDPLWPSAINSLYPNTAVSAVIGAPGDEGALNPESLKPLLG